MVRGTAATRSRSSLNLLRFPASYRGDEHCNLPGATLVQPPIGRHSPSPSPTSILLLAHEISVARIPEFPSSLREGPLVVTEIGPNTGQAVRRPHSMADNAIGLSGKSTGKVTEGSTDSVHDLVLEAPLHFVHSVGTPARVEPNASSPSVIFPDHVTPASVTRVRFWAGDCSSQRKAPGAVGSRVGAEWIGERATHRQLARSCQGRLEVDV